MIFWIDKSNKKYFKKEIDDAYLMNIAKALTKGIGNSYFVNNRVIQEVMEECFNRGLLTSEEAFDMIEKAKYAFEQRNSYEYNQIKADIEYEERVYGLD